LYKRLELRRGPNAINTFVKEYGITHIVMADHFNCGIGNSFAVRCSNAFSALFRVPTWWSWTPFAPGRRGLARLPRMARLTD
jgi:hypothetical protein